jgi:hypothetical protein
MVSLGRNCMRTLPILSEADAVGRSRRHVSACQVHSRVALGHFRPALDVPVPRVFIEFLSGMGIGLASTAKRWPRAEAPGEKFFTSVFQKCVIYVCLPRTHKRGVRVVTNVEGGMRWKRRHPGRVPPKRTAKSLGPDPRRCPTPGSNSQAILASDGGNQTRCTGETT